MFHPTLSCCVAFRHVRCQSHQIDVTWLFHPDVSTAGMRPAATIGIILYGRRFNQAAGIQMNHSTAAFLDQLPVMGGYHYGGATGMKTL